MNTFIELKYAASRLDQGFFLRNSSPVTIVYISSERKEKSVTEIQTHPASVTSCKWSKLLCTTK